MTLQTQLFRATEPGNIHVTEYKRINLFSYDVNTPHLLRHGSITTCQLHIKIVIRPKPDAIEKWQ